MHKNHGVARVSPAIHWNPPTLPFETHFQSEKQQQLFMRLSDYPQLLNSVHCPSLGNSQLITMTMKCSTLGKTFSGNDIHSNLAMLISTINY